MAFNSFLKRKKRDDSKIAPDTVLDFNRPSGENVPSPVKKEISRYTNPYAAKYKRYAKIPGNPFNPKPENEFYEPGLPAKPHEGELLPASVPNPGANPKQNHTENTPDNLLGQSSPENNHAADGSSGQDGNPGDSFEDYYNRLIAALQSYGVNLTLPTLEELYSQLEAFLRPSVDAAIENRQHYGDTALAELDADAYARGMGGSSYLSGMKYREYEDMVRDIAALETKYGAALAEYLYDITAEINDIQTRLAAAALANSNSNANAGGHSGHGHGGGGHGHGGSEEQGSDEQSGEQEQQAENGIEPSGTTFDQYRVYFECLTDAEIESFFHSPDEYWVNLRNQMAADISPDEYEYLLETYDTYKPEQPAPKVPGGHGNSWYHTPY